MANQKIQCYVCGSPNLMIPISRVWRNWMHNPQVAFCHNCSLYFLLPKPTEWEIRDHYQHYSRSLSRPQKGLKQLFRKYRSISQYEYIKSRNTSKQNSVLEVGTGEGTLLGIYLHHGSSVFGVELNSHARKRSLIKYGIPTSNQTYSTVDGSYDIVLMSHILEHFHCPREALRHTAEILNPDGLLFIEVPHSPIIPEECSREELEKYLQTDHIYNFRPDNLRMLVEQEGYEVIALDRAFYNIPFSPGQLTRKKIGQALLQGTPPKPGELLFIGTYMLGNLLRLHRPFRILQSLDIPWQGQGDSIRMLARVGNSSQCF